MKKIVKFVVSVTLLKKPCDSCLDIFGQNLCTVTCCIFNFLNRFIYVFLS